MKVKIRKHTRQFSRMYPVNETAKLLMMLKLPYHSTFREEDIETIKLLGFEVEFMKGD